MNYFHIDVYTMVYFSMNDLNVMSLKVIYFQPIFLIDFYIKRLIYMQESGINFTKFLCSRELKKKAEIAVKRSRMWQNSTDIIG